MNQQDELEKLIRKIDETTDGLGEWHDATEYLEWARKEVQRILNASRPRVVETIEELEALPDGSIVLDRKSRLWRTYRDGDHDCVDLVGIPSEVPLPATVIHLPKETS